jgi:hypothetical protein
MTHQSTNRRVSSSLMQRSEIRILAAAYSTEPLPKAFGANVGFRERAGGRFERHSFSR